MLHEVVSTPTGSLTQKLVPANPTMGNPFGSTTSTSYHTRPAEWQRFFAPTAIELPLLHEHRQSINCTEALRCWIQHCDLSQSTQLEVEQCAFGRWDARGQPEGDGAVVPAQIHLHTINQSVAQATESHCPLLQAAIIVLYRSYAPVLPQK